MIVSIILISGIALFVFSPIRNALETTLVTHFLVEYTAYILIGFLFGSRYFGSITKRLERFNQGGISGILLATFVILFWMIPRWMEASIDNAFVALFRAFSLTFLAGFALAVSWPLSNAITRSLVKIEFLAMLFRLGWIYQISPNRLCNNYLINDQILFGEILIIIGCTLSIYWLILVFFEPDIGKIEIYKVGKRKYLPKKHL